MKVYAEIRLTEFTPWSGAEYTFDKIIENDKVIEFEELVDELFPDGLSEMELNDFLWFDDEMIFESLGIEIGEDGNV